MRLPELLRGVDVAEWSGDPDVEVTSLVHDSRRAEPGSCFACLRGTRTDGHDHASDAVARGAHSLLVERLLPLEVAQVRVADVRSMLGPVAARLAGDPSRHLRCVGVTGTNGKTTTVHLLDAIGRAADERVGVVGTLGTRVDASTRPATLTTPEAPELQATLASMRAEGIGLVAMEVSSHALVRHRIDGTWFAAACFTNLSHDHLDEHGTIDDYFAAKSMLFTPERSAVAITNLDDSFGERIDELATAAGLAVWTHAIHDPRARVAATGISYGSEATDYELIDRGSGQRGMVRSSLLGEINVANQLTAATAALAVGLPFDAVRRGLESPIVVAGRLERVDRGGPFPVIVDYAHTPDALARVLETARLLGRRVVLVFGCGGDRDRGKRPMMGAVAGRGADLVYLTSDNPRTEEPAAIAAEVRGGIPETADYVVELDRRSAIRAALGAAGPGDVVVIAGKGHETGQTTAGVTIPFDDRSVAREELERRRCA